MGRYDFDTVPDRRNTNCLKHDFGMEYKGRDDLLSLWVADMDFRMPDEVLEDIMEKVRHGIFGYTEPDRHYYEIVSDWYRRRHCWEIGADQITAVPGVVYGFAQAIQAFTKPGDAVIINQPVYYPFASTILKNDRRLVNSELLYIDGRYEIDFEDFERKIKDNAVRMFILCSPHNPVCRVWTREELIKLCDICFRYDVQIVSDEIHGDFVFSGNHFIPIASLGPDVADRVIVCTSPSKTFNIAGLQIANMVIPGKKLRDEYRLQMARGGYFHPNVFGFTACESVYEKGEPWLTELLSYLQGNMELVSSFLEEHIPTIHLVKPEGTYLLWLDCSGLSLSYRELEQLFVEKAHLWLDSGRMFGRASDQFERINIACPKSVLRQALMQLKEAVEG